jgi:hypothetical protein
VRLPLQPLVRTASTTPPALTGQSGGWRRHTIRRHGQAEISLARSQREIDLGEQLRIEQCAVEVTMRIVDTEAPAQGVEAVALAREAFACECRGYRTPPRVR